MRYDMRPYRKLFILIFLGGIASGVAIPFLFNWVELTNTSSAERLRDDMVKLGTRIETFRGEHGRLPELAPMVNFTHAQDGLRLRGGAGLTTYAPGTGTVPGLTTPFAYVNDMWPDYFSEAGNFPIAFHHDGTRWLLFAMGPDRLYNIVPKEQFGADFDDMRARLAPLTYDPTNGTYSAGDIWWAKELGEEP